MILTQVLTHFSVLLSYLKASWTWNENKYFFYITHWNILVEYLLCKVRSFKDQVKKCLNIKNNLYSDRRVLLSLPVKSPQRGVSETSKHSPIETQMLVVMASTISVDCCTSQRLRRPGPCFQACLVCPKGTLLAWKLMICESSETGTWSRAMRWSGKSLCGQ